MLIYKDTNQSKKVKEKVSRYIRHWDVKVTSKNKTKEI